MISKTPGRIALLLGVLTARLATADPTAISYDAKPGPGQGRHVVLLAGDEEYRSEECLPMLAKILSQHHGFKCTVLFSVDTNGVIHPGKGESLSQPEALDHADAIVMLLRFRHWDEATTKRFDDALKRGVPVIALRTSTHAFNGYAKGSAWEKWNHNQAGGWGKKYLGETWVTHWGKHKIEATRGVIEPAAASDPLLRGVTDVFGDSDVYEAYPPPDAKILLRGLVLSGMKPTDPPAQYMKKRATDKQEQPVNDPAMPVAWTREFTNESGKVNRIFCTTLGAATDFQNEGLRRLVVNAVFWGLGLDVLAKAAVDYVDPYQPRFYGFGGFRPGLRAADHALGKTLPDGQPTPAAPTKQEGAGAKPLLQLNPAERIAFIGNALPDRMQHHGWLETLIVARFPKHDLVFRNLGFSGDEVSGFLNEPGPAGRYLRQRSENFGSNDEWLTQVKADVVFAYFGFNESFAGPAGLAGFRRDLDTFLKETRAKKYNGQAAPRVVLFSPLAAEPIPDPNQPATAERNLALKQYTDAMAEVAKANGVAFVDLFALSQPLYAEAARAGHSLTFNTIHLTERGDHALAPHIFRALFAEAAPTGDWTKLRAAINEKNWEFHQRYRTVDGYNVYGGRSRLEFGAALKDGATPAETPSGRSRRSPQNPDAGLLSNNKVMQEEMAQRDVKTANRDQRVWAVARGGDLVAKDDNLPPLTEVPPNRADVAPYLSGEEAIKKMTVAKGCKVNLFADERAFPELVNPVQMAWDTKGRLWVAVWPGYPELTPTATVKDKLLIFEDTNHDGVADKCITFLDGLNCPTGFQFYKDGVLVVQAPDLWWVRDTDGDDKPDSRERVLGGIDSADSHHTANSLVLDPGGATYLSDGVFHRAQTETPWGVVRNTDAAIFRYEPLTHRYERHAAYGFANPHGRVFDRWGNDLITDATGNANYFGPAMSGFIDFPAKHPELKKFWTNPSRPCAGTGLVSSGHFPEAWQGNFLNCNVLGFRGIYRVKVSEDGAGLRGESLEDFLQSDDPNFRPSAVNCAPDGSIYVLDWAQQLIGHMQHHIRDPNRDHRHGRIYRVTYEGRPLLKPERIYGEPVAKLLEVLKSPEDDVRTRAKIELGKYDATKVIAATETWVAALDPSDPGYQHHLLEALWVHQWVNVVNEPLLKQLLRSTDHRARAAATRVLGYWRDRVSDPLALLKVQATDANPRVRLEAVRVASFFRDAGATEIALAAKKLPTDYYLTYVIRETLRQLEQFWRPALAQGRPVATGNPEGLNLLLRSLSLAELQKLPRTEPVQLALLTRAEAADAVRAEALLGLAAARKKSGAGVVLDTLATLDKSDAASAALLARMLPLQPPATLAPERARLVKLTTASAAEVRQPAWAAVTLADRSIDSTWKLAAQSAASLTDWLAGLPQVLEQNLRVGAYQKVQPLLAGIPPELATRLQLQPGSAASESLRTAAIRAAASIPVAPEKTFAALATLMAKGELLPVAAAGIRVLPRATWTKPEAATAAAALVAWAKKAPAAERTSSEYIETVQTAGELAGSLPAEQAAAVRSELKSLRVDVFIIRTVREQMRFDVPRIVVAAGKPFELIIENTDFMPHNLVVVNPGSREIVGAVCETMKPSALDSEGRAFVPDHPDVLAATKLLESAQQARLRLPSLSAGDYEYVCTFPGHWQVMWGQLIVTKDVDAYLVAHPEAVRPKAASHQHGHSEFE